MTLPYDPLSHRAEREAETARRLEIAREPEQWWYYARVKNSAGMHTVFYATKMPVVGEPCNGIAAPNRITGFWRRPILKTKLTPEPAFRDSTYVSDGRDLADEAKRKGREA
jgi:hypothetical protein